MLELFRAEAESQTAALTAGLLEVDAGKGSPECYKDLMRAAHSLKGAARIVNLSTVEKLAHALEDCFEAARRGTLRLARPEIDILLRSVDTLQGLAKAAQEEDAAAKPATRPLPELLQTLKDMSGASKVIPQNLVQEVPKDSALDPSATVPTVQPGAVRRADSEERVLRLAPENLNRLLGLAGESLVESRWLRTFADSLQRLKRHHMALREQVDQTRTLLEGVGNPASSARYLSAMVQELSGAQQFLAERIQELDTYDRRASHLSQRLYLEVLRTRMRPFKDGVRRFPRMVRDLARSLNKQVRLEITGESTQVDRDILERLETPLGHLIRNAIDHGCEPSDVRLRSGKAAEAVISLEARHSAGVLLVAVADDGAGVQTEDLRRTLVRKQLVSLPVAEKLTDAELLEYLFVPGFTLKQTVTEISGRGYGLDLVQNMVRNVRGSIRLQNQVGRGFRLQLQLPLTLSVLRALLVEVAGEPYAVPLNQVSRSLKVPAAQVHFIDRRPYLPFANQQLPLCSAHELLESGVNPGNANELCVIVVGERGTRQGIIVDKFIGERELVVQPIPAVLGAVKRVSAAALTEDGAPVLILDVDDLLRSAPRTLPDAASLLQRPHRHDARRGPKRVLVVDDSATVRKLEQHLLVQKGYLAETALDGMEAWGAIRTGNYDLVITDLEMPRMNGLELAKRIKQDPELSNTAVLIISYKDGEEDRLKGLDAGADYYLTKGSFHDLTLLRAVCDLIGEPSV